MVCPKVIKNYPTDGRILICEICDFLLLDFNAFRDHMFTIHKVRTKKVYQEEALLLGFFLKNLGRDFL